jgi:hypothetical protein
MSPARRTHKPKLLFDEGFPPRKSFSNLNRYCNVRHVAHDVGLSGASDDKVYSYACKEERLMVTFNIRDFRPNIPETGMTVIGVSAKMKVSDMDAKLTSLIKRLKPSDYRGRYIAITNET